MTATTKNYPPWRQLAVAAGASAILLAACAESDGADDPAAEQDQPADVDLDEARLQVLLDEWLADTEAFGATLSVRVPGHDDVHLASGVGDRDITTVTVDGAQFEHTEAAMPTDGTYDVMSVTKTFTAAAALQLVDEGRLSLDEPVEPWLPELPNADQVTLAMLLNHTSGLASWTGPPDEHEDYVVTLIEDLTRSFTPEEVLAKHVEQPLVGEPGERSYYSNANFDAVGVLIERELEQNLASVFAEQFAEPLALDDTVLSDGTRSPTRHGWFSLEGDPERANDYLDGPAEAVMTSLWAAGGVISSSADLLDWGAALFSGELLGEEMTAAMLERDLGLDCLRGCASEGAAIVGKGGGAPWTEVLLAHHLDSGTTVVVHANAEGAVADPLVVDVIRELGFEAGNVLEAGSHTTEQFHPALSYTVPSSWEVFADEPGILAMVTEDEVAGGLFIVADPVALHPDPQDEANAPQAAEGVGSSADDLLAWLVEHPELEATEPEPVTVGGLEGTQLDVRIVDGSTSLPFYCDVEACVDVIGQDPDDPDITDPLGLLLYGMDDALRVILLAADNVGTVAIIADPYGEADADEAFLAEVRTIVDSFEFE